VAVRAIKQKHDGRQQACTSAERKVSPRRARRGKHWGARACSWAAAVEPERTADSRVPEFACVCQGRTGILVAGRSLLMVIVAQSVGDARCQLDRLVPGASAGLLLIDCALFAACLSLPLQ